VVGDKDICGIRYSDISILSEMQIKSVYLNDGYDADSWKADLIRTVNTTPAGGPESKKPNLKGWAFCWVFRLPVSHCPMVNRYECTAYQQKYHQYGKCPPAASCRWPPRRRPLGFRSRIGEKGQVFAWPVRWSPVLGETLTFGRRGQRTAYPDFWRLARWLR